jgi:DNA-binding MarR family transcriptional regulator
VPEDPATVADVLHSAAIHVLRRASAVDPESGLTPARLSALSVVVFAGPLTVGDLAAAEQVRSPTMTSLVNGLEAAGLVARRADPDDGRAVQVVATAKGRRVLQRARARRVAALTERLGRLPQRDLATLRRAAALMERAAAAD